MQGVVLAIVNFSVRLSQAGSALCQSDLLQSRGFHVELDV